MRLTDPGRQWKLTDLAIHCRNTRYRHVDILSDETVLVSIVGRSLMVVYMMSQFGRLIAADGYIIESNIAGL
ncbi:hypothetical protein KCU70_g188, partial [Aureobasidium melanogenum]